VVFTGDGGEGQKMRILGKIFHNILNWQITVPQLEGIVEIEKLVFITDFVTISTPNLVE